jgi:predicted transposase YdaD
MTAPREVKTDAFAVSKARFEAVIRAAEQSGLLSGKSGRIGGRVSPALVRQAKRQTGIETDTDLIEFALATVALEDNFAETFKKSRGKVDPALKLGF